MAKQGKQPVPNSSSDDIVQKLAARIKSLRTQKGFSNYEKFANAHDLNRAQYGRYEKGTDLRVSSLAKVVKALDVSLEEFFSEGFD